MNSTNEKIIQKIYLGYACHPPYVIFGVKELTLKQPLSEKEAIARIKNRGLSNDDFVESFKDQLSYLPTAYKYVFDLCKKDAFNWAFHEATDD